ncbi:fructosamine kinase family protein [Echinicola vietnamensis]|uniref:Fructosamine-3-kinase n=1 Tax=Echinicola vietnamensis (strain DSM 17526 / LMG 23754 / KMM 6221) TaxID=926556 RepID=L0FXS3_ECHVK|nr:fructosamine kinase family protein [Echinicola vietnamensis]AGA78087.1 fructosamine-3-kinase [Echinicola vietnamensis DSM 17526]
MHKSHSFYEEVLTDAIPEPTKLKSVRLISAGTMNQSVLLDTDKGALFLKSNHLPSSDMFLQEIKGLTLLHKHAPLQIPKTIGAGRIASQNYMLIEWIHGGYPNASYWKNLGHGLAELHMATSPQFGLDEDNYIAALPQRNTFNNNWPDFFAEERLEPMAGKAYYDGLISKDFYKKLQQVYPKLKDLIPNEKPSLLHGDLWSGNVIVNTKGDPCLIDPAIYFGHREMDLAFSKLFGGFRSEFYEAYHEIFPLEPDFESRVDIHNLYPLLVHLNLFGQSYLPGIKKVVKKLL